MLHFPLLDFKPIAQVLSVLRAVMHGRKTGVLLKNLTEMEFAVKLKPVRYPVNRQIR